MQHFNSIIRWQAFFVAIRILTHSVTHFCAHCRKSLDFIAYARGEMGQRLLLPLMLSNSLCRGALTKSALHLRAFQKKGEVVVILMMAQTV
jgi:hypothetical protein